MGRPPRDQARDTRQAILDAALELFADKGFFGTTLREIAAAVGVRESALYHYFDSKEALFSAILRSHHPSEEEIRWLRTAEIVDLEPFLEQVATYMVKRFTTLEQRRIHQIMMSDGLRLAREAKIDFNQKLGPQPIIGLMERLVKEGWLRGDPHLLAVEFFAPFIVYQHVLASHGELIPPPFPQSPTVFARLHIAQFLHGALTPRKK